MTGRRRIAVVAGLGLLVCLAVAGAVMRPRGTPPADVSTVATAPLVAHGQLVPSRFARVGTLTGGVVRAVDVLPGDQVADRAPIAWVESAAGTEVLTAPFAGTVTNVLVHSGDTVAPASTLLQIGDVRTLQVETSDVDQFLVGRLRRGQVVPVTVDALDDRRLTGEVVSVAEYPQTEPATSGQMYPVVIRLAATPPAVRPGMSVRITLDAQPASAEP
jgi:multidrug efflux pump subunit AcrA (membrane-fusion protein)